MRKSEMFPGRAGADSYRYDADLLLDIRFSHKNQ